MRAVHPRVCGEQVRSLPSIQRCQLANELEAVPGGAEGWRGVVQLKALCISPQGGGVHSRSFQVLREVVECNGFQPVAEGAVLPGGCLLEALSQGALNHDGSIVNSCHESLQDGGKGRKFFPLAACILAGCSKVWVQISQSSHYLKCCHPTR